MKEIPNWPGYFCDHQGNIYTFKGKGGKILEEPKAMSLQKDHMGYLMVRLWKHKKRTKCHVHRLVLETFVGPCPEGNLCRHLNDLGDDNRLSNLRWGSYSDNKKDIIRNKSLTRFLMKKYPEILEEFNSQKV